AGEGRRLEVAKKAPGLDGGEDDGWRGTARSDAICKTPPALAQWQGPFRRVGNDSRGGSAMPAPQNVDDFLELVRNSGVVDRESLEAHVRELRAAGRLPEQPARLAALLVRD